jgi:hypothetical protein
MIIRDDLSNKLIHFTRDSGDMNASERFYSIVSQGKIIGGRGFIKGGYRCICFTESPIAKFPYVFSSPEFPYAPLGIMIDKVWLYEKGGRPVIYQADEEYNLLDESQKYRHKLYNPLKGIDYTWEREWRIHQDELTLDSTVTTLVVPNRKWVEEFKKKHTQSIRNKAMIFKDQAWFMIKDFPWHFIALEDLGVKID